MPPEEKPGKKGAPPKKPEVEPEEAPLREAPAPGKIEPDEPWPRVEPDKRWPREP